MKSSRRIKAPTVPMTLYLDQDTNLRILKAKDRSGRPKSTEAMIRLRDHLQKFPDFYNSDLVEVIPNNLKKRSNS